MINIFHLIFQLEGQLSLSSNKILLNCLRCNSPNIFIEKYYSDSSTQNLYRCSCENLHRWDEWCDTKDEAIDLWNERPLNVQ